MNEKGKDVGAYSRIDMFLMSNCYSSQVTKCDIQPSVLTDHSMIDLEVELEAYKEDQESGNSTQPF